MTSSNPAGQPGPVDPAEKIEVPLAGETQFEREVLPRPADPGKQIHPRRPLPLVPDAAPDASSTPGRETSHESGQQTPGASNSK